MHNQEVVSDFINQKAEKLNFNQDFMTAHFGVALRKLVTRTARGVYIFWKFIKFFTFGFNAEQVNRKDSQSLETQKSFRAVKAKSAGQKAILSST
jgi:hypothetical protein